MSIQKAVFPVGGLGTRFLPATKASPKEMLPLVDKPIIQYAVEEAVAAGIEQVRWITQLANFAYVRQGEPLGLGHAILCARNLVGNEPFAVLLGDDIIRARTPALRQLLRVHERHGGPVLAIQKVPGPAIRDYGVIKGRRVADGVWQVIDVVEKPEPKNAPSDMAVIGRYVLTPAVFRYLEETKPGRGGEIQLTDALRKMAQDYPIFACEFEGVRYDAGNKLGFLQATVEYALASKELGPAFRRYLDGLQRRRAR